LDQRVRDGVIRRTIDKWLKAGVLENGCVSHPDTGVPQGSGVSPLLSNLFLHEVLDTWFEHVVKPRLEGNAVLVRFADDAIILCARERDANRVMAVLPVSGDLKLLSGWQVENVSVPFSVFFLNI
jgi:retron-type reverse transcriptase